jgi:hypothetical protein
MRNLTVEFVKWLTDFDKEWLEDLTPDEMKKWFTDMLARTVEK